MQSIFDEFKIYSEVNFSVRMRLQMDFNQFGAFIWYHAKYNNFETVGKLGINLKVSWAMLKLITTFVTIVTE